MENMITSVLHTPALPRDYVVELADGTRYRVPAGSLFDDKDIRQFPLYRGNYTLEQAVPHDHLVRLANNARRTDGKYIDGQFMERECPTE